MEPSTVPATQPLGVGDVYRLFYARVAGRGFHRGDFEATLEDWKPNHVKVQKIRPHEQGGIAGYYADVVVLEPGTSNELFRTYVVTGDTGQPAYGEFRKAETQLLGNRYSELGVDAIQSWDDFVDWLQEGDARDAIVGAVEDVGRATGRVVGGTAGEAAESFGPFRTGALVLGAAAVGAYILSRNL